ncbi:MAG: hypothetical protein N2C14_34230 [Planctomycetales bacterium]
MNFNAIAMVDRDKDSEEAPLDPKAIRIREELSKLDDGMFWVVAGRTVENYIPDDVLEAEFKPIDEEFTAPDKFTKVLDNLPRTRKKVRLAIDICKQLTDKSQIASHLDLAERLDEVCDLIRKWNDLSPEDVAE